VNLRKVRGEIGEVNFVFVEDPAVSGNYTRLIGDSSFRDYLDLFEFRSPNAKEFGHLDDLIRTYEIRGLGTEFLYAGGKLAALHGLRRDQAKAACVFRGVKQTEFANSHFFTAPFGLRMRMHEPAYAIGE
jgi:hypothetical protein